MDTPRLRRLLVGLCFLLAVWSLYYSSPLLSTLREFAHTEPRGMLRLLLSLLPVLMIGAALGVAPRKRRLLFWPLVVVSLLVMLDVTFGGRDPDEPVHLNMAWLIGEGLAPYRDFFAVRHMLWHVLCIPMISLMEDSVYIVHVARFVTFLTSVAFLVLVALLARRCQAHPIAPLLAVAVPFFSWGAVEFRADPSMTLLLLGAIWAIYRKSPLWAGVLSGIAYLMLQKAAIHGLAMGVGILLAGMGWRCFLQYSVAAVGVSLLHALWALLWGLWNDYYICTLESSTGFAAFHQGTPLLKSLSMIVVGEELRYFPLLFVLAGIGCALWWRSKEPFERFLAVCLVVDLGLVFMSKIAFKNYLLFPVVLLALAASRAFTEAESQENPSRLEGALPTIIVLLMLTVGYVRHSALPPTRIDTSEAQLLLEILPPEETYYTDSLRGNLVSPIYRKSPSYFPHSASRFRIWLGEEGAARLQALPGSDEQSWEPLPGAFSMEKDRNERYLDFLREVHNVEYVEIAPDIYVRPDLLSEAQKAGVRDVSETVRPIQP